MRRLTESLVLPAVRPERVRVSAEGAERRDWRMQSLQESI